MKVLNHWHDRKVSTRDDRGTHKHGKSVTDGQRKELIIHDEDPDDYIFTRWLRRSPFFRGTHKYGERIDVSIPLMDAEDRAFIENFVRIAGQGEWYLRLLDGWVGYLDGSLFTFVGPDGNRTISVTREEVNSFCDLLQSVGEKLALMASPDDVEK